MRDLRIKMQPTKDGSVLALEGELLFADSQDFMLKIPQTVENKGKEIVFDMDGLKFIDSSGLGSILYISQALNMRGQQLTIVNPNENIHKLLRTINKVGTFKLEAKRPQ
jgi:anti-sigma B factor antagonist